MPATTRTYLLGDWPKNPWSGFYCVPYLVLLLLCVVLQSNLTSTTRGQWSTRLHLAWLGLERRTKLPKMKLSSTMIGFMYQKLENVAWEEGSKKYHCQNLARFLVLNFWLLYFWSTLELRACKQLGLVPDPQSTFSITKTPDGQGSIPVAIELFSVLNSVPLFLISHWPSLGRIFG